MHIRSYSVHRGRLQMLLLDARRAIASAPTPFVTGAELTGFDADRTTACRVDTVGR